MIHKHKHKWAGQVRKYKMAGVHPGLPIEGEFRVEDWADRLWRQSWGLMQGNPTAMSYAMRTATIATIPGDDQVIYGHIDGLAYLMHESELS